MKCQKNQAVARAIRAFTLIELLVVIAILTAGVTNEYYQLVYP